MAFCSPCIAGDLTTYTVDACDLKSATLKSGISRLVFVKCNYAFTTLSSSSEWTTIMGNDTAKITQQGKAVFPEPAFESLEIDACGTKIDIDGKFEIEFSTFLLDGTTDLHNTFINDFNQSSNSYTCFIVGCDGRFYYQHGWITGNNGGFGINSGKAFLKDEGKLKAMFFKIELNASTGLYGSFPMTSAFKTALGI